MKKDMRAAAMAIDLSVHVARGFTRKFAAERGPNSMPMYSAESQTEHSNHPEANINSFARHSAMMSGERGKEVITHTVFRALITIAETHFHTSNNMYNENKTENLGRAAARSSAQALMMPDLGSGPNESLIAKMKGSIAKENMSEARGHPCKTPLSRRKQ